MAAETIRIDELHLRVPGLGREEARRLGEEVARRLAEELPREGRPQRLASLDLRTSVPATTPRAGLADAIVRAIRRSLR
jgi:hypothetical protein